jgi:hypothetical protein
MISSISSISYLTLALVSALGGLRLLFTLLLAAWLLRERWPTGTLPVRLVGIGCMVLGLILIA